MDIQNDKAIKEPKSKRIKQFLGLTDRDLGYKIWKLWRSMTYPFRKFYYWVSASLSYSRFLWDYHYDWDYYSFIKLMIFKLKKMEHQQRKYGNAVDHIKYADQIKKAIRGLEKIAEENVGNKLRDIHDKKWGTLHMDLEPIYKEDGKIKYHKSNFWRDGAQTEEKKKQEHEEFLKFIEHEEKLIRKYNLHVFKFIAKHFKYWWD